MNDQQRIPGMSLSLWHATSKSNHGKTLTPPEKVDVCVVGAGIAGLTTAYLLAKEGKSVVVVDMGDVGGGETGQTSAHLSPILGTRYYDLADMHGDDGARVIAEAHVSAVNAIEEIVTREHIDCGFMRVQGFLFLGPEDTKENLDKECEALNAVGISCERVDAIPGVEFESGPAIRVHNQARFHPMQYVLGLAEALQSSGASIVRGKVTDFNDEDGVRLVVTEDGRTIRANDVVVASNSPVNSMVSYHTKQVAYRTYVIAMRVPKETVPAHLIWDTADPYHYIRTAPLSADAPHNSSAENTEELVLVGGEDHQTGHHEEGASPWGNLEAWARKRFPQAGAIEYRWSGQVMESIDGIGFNGRDNDDHTYVITGDSGNGLTNGTLGARIVADMILGRENPWAETFSAGRIPVKSAGDWFAGAGNAIVHLAERIVNTDAPSCTHLGCVLAWNESEESWDCPCHGSRYDARGKVLHGPAVTDLKLENTDAPAVRLEPSVTG